MFICKITIARQLKHPEIKAIVAVRFVKFLDQLIFMYVYYSRILEEGVKYIQKRC